MNMEDLLINCDVDPNDYIEIQDDEPEALVVTTCEDGEYNNVVLNRAKVEQLAAWINQWLNVHKPQDKTL